MSLLPYRFFVYLNSILGLSLVIVPWIISPSTSTANLVLSIIGLLILGSVTFSHNSGLPVKSMWPERAALFLVFLMGVVLNFTPYFLNFTDNSNLLITIFVVSGLGLFSLIFSDFNPAEDS